MQVNGFELRAFVFSICELLQLFYLSVQVVVIELVACTRTRITLSSSNIAWNNVEAGAYRPRLFAALIADQYLCFRLECSSRSNFWR